MVGHYWESNATHFGLQSELEVGQLDRVWQYMGAFERIDIFDNFVNHIPIIFIICMSFFNGEILTFFKSQTKLLKVL